MAASTPDNLYPIFDRVLGRADKEAKLKQRGRVIWLYGLSGSGKSTLAIALERRLHAEGFTTHLLDGDNVRSGLNRDLGFTDADRAENIRRIAEVAKLFVQAGVVVIAAFITPQRAHRQLARTIIGADDFSEVYVAASFDTCAARDPKGLYAKAKAGNVQQFTGRDSSFEAPLAEDLEAQIIDTEAGTAADSLNQLHTAILPRITFQ
ncbi:MAG: adenylyl-sulfate kinase [Opitutus sp.]|nr:adenylyl-sulfate kinase [Opitutus sp.]MCS6246796.1 adenylyl-sulfate kinase [Opitutus sp.]MCS6272878.1 adenylyl-sulfate kinase [Opitutus sp.]MCS6278876.1 adenylyl-sulfate kinase [Opitutus sp.]MCS6299546.1 adenylyl-sulfate kinase [Opitutus sp.]